MYMVKYSALKIDEVGSKITLIVLIWDELKTPPNRREDATEIIIH